MQPRINAQDVNLDRLVDVIREEGAPIPLTTLAREVIRSYLTTDNGMPVFAPGERYAPGMRLRLNGLVGNVVNVERGQNAVQGAFKILTLNLEEGERVRVAAEVDYAPTSISPDMISGHIVDSLYEDQEVSLVRQVRQVVAADPRFITLYYNGVEYGCLREFFPPMSPDVLDAALAVLLDSLFDRGRIPIQQVIAPRLDAGGHQNALLKPDTLFSDRYLARTLQRDPDWDADLTSIYETLRALWVRARSYGHDWDAQKTETALVQPLFTALGWSSVPLSALDSKTTDSGLTPKFHSHVLCRDPAACAALCIHQGSLRSASGWALALAQTAPWSGSLDAYLQPASHWWRLQEEPEGDRFSPSYQMVRSLMQHDVSWGILTNGRQWRLFTRRAKSLITGIYEVDLDPLFDRPDEGRSLTPDAWVTLRQWWMLFRRDAFIKRDEGGSFLDRLYASSPAQRQATLAHQQECVVHTVFPALVGGFVAYRNRRLGISEEADESLNMIKRASVSLLTRILFLLVAEAQYLLPVDDPEYYAQSLTSLLSWADSCTGRYIAPSQGIYSTSRYDVLLSLLHRVNSGDAVKSLPEYGPAFFDPKAKVEHAFIAEHGLSDVVVAEVLNALQREIDGLNFTAYALGAVLETLLDADLQVVDAAAGKVEVLDAATNQDRCMPMGVPDYVAKDVVGHALKPLIAQRGAQFARIMDRVVELRRKLQRTLDPGGRADLQAALDVVSHGACEAFLGMRVVDPSMGSGTFLLSALDVITDHVIVQMQAYHDTHPEVPWRWNPIQRLLNRVRHDIASELRRQGIEMEDLALDDVSLLRRLLAQRCLYGVDNNPSAVDLTQTRLWLRTFMAGAPLIFFDHHLRQGDSLTGTDLDSLRDLTYTPLEMKEMFKGVSMMYSVTDRVNTSSLDVRWSMRQFERVEQAIGPYRQYFHLNVAAAVGDDGAQALLNRWGSSLLQALQGKTFLDDETMTTLRRAVDAGSCFHWPLMFLDAFVDFERGVWLDKPGFDAVIGQIPVMTEQQLARMAQLLPDSGIDTPDERHQGFVRMAHRLTAPRGGQTACVLARTTLASGRECGTRLAING